MNDLIDPESWWSHVARRWDEPSLDANAVARVLGTTPATIRQILLSDNDFPKPEARGSHGRNLWIPSVIYAYVRARHSRTRDRIPRLWCPGILNPARFLRAQEIVLPAHGWSPAQTYVLHVWQPSDESGPIAIAYPLNTNDPSGGRNQAAVELFRELSGTVAAVAVPCGDASRVVVPGDGVWQPAMYVVDTSTIDADEIHEQVVEYGWYEIARLVQTDVPWWPANLRDRDAMLTWRPGDPIRRILPASGSYGPQPLLDFIDRATMTPTLRGIVTGLAEDVANELARSAMNEAQDYAPHPGMIHAAVADANTSQWPRPRRPGDIALLLHHRVADHKFADRMLAVVNGHPVVTGAMTIRPDLAAADPLVGKWCQGLKRVPSEHRDELGYRLLDTLRPAAPNEPSAPVAQWCTHISDPDIWAVITEDGTIHTTVGSAVAATGHLTAALVTSTAAFFQTSTGQVWALPHKYMAGFNAGYDGAGPHDLTQTLSRLVCDASADVDAPEGRVENDPAIWKAVRQHPLPLRWNLAR